MSEFQKAVDLILRNEGYVKGMEPRGGFTSFGWTLMGLRGAAEKQNQLADINGDGKITIDDVMSMSLPDAVELYRKIYWEYNGYNQIENQDIATKIFDGAVNLGEWTAHKLVQGVPCLEGYKLIQDGVLGPRSIGAINNTDPYYLLPDIRVAYLLYYQQILAADPSAEPNCVGWFRRACR